jgi:hypothetical protein
MKLDNIDIIRAQALETAVEAGFYQSRCPIREWQPRCMTAFGQQVEILAAIPYDAAEQLFAIAITRRRIDHV